jgi:hypothetical protein
LLSSITPDLVKEFVDAGLDRLEAKIAESETGVDDKLVLPLINKIRSLCNIPKDVPADDIL